MIKPFLLKFIIAGLRSAKMRELIDWDKSNRYAVSLQNRLFKGLQGLVLMDQQELTLQNALPKPSSPSCEVIASTSDGETDGMGAIAAQ